MLATLTYKRADQALYAYDDAGELIDYWECRDAFVPGYNDYGQPRASLPNGTYNGPNDQGLMAEITGGAYGPAYGTFYITTGDPRGRDIHGGGSGLEDPFSPYQGWVPTLGCLRMQNQDGEQVAAMIEESDLPVSLSVVEE